MSRKQVGTSVIVGGVVLGLLLLLLTGQWFWLAILAGTGTAIGASMYSTPGSTGRRGRDPERPAAG